MIKCDLTSSGVQWFVGVSLLKSIIHVRVVFLNAATLILFILLKE